MYCPRALLKLPPTGRDFFFALRTALLPGHPGGAVVRRQWVAAGGWCLLAWGAGGGAGGGGGVLLVGPGAVGARAWPPAGPWGRTVARMS